MRKVLYVAVSFHGYGHIGQTAPVVIELWRRNADLDVVIESAAPTALLQARFTIPFLHVQCATDFGMVMTDALEVDVECSHEHYVALHRNWGREVEATVERLRAHRPALVFSNVAYLPLVAAKRLGLPAVALSCLNWGDIYGSICAGLPGCNEIAETICDAYNQADRFIKVVPTMPMPVLNNTVEVGPIASLGRQCYEEIVSRARLDAGQQLVVVSMGGTRTTLNLQDWPKIEGIVWFLDAEAVPSRSDMVSIASLSVPYLDVVSSADALITKPGYGAFAEAACSRIPVLYVPRPLWPEAPFLTSWLKSHAQCLEIERQDLSSARLGEALKGLWSMPARPAIEPTGIAEAADVLESLLYG